MPVWLGRYLLEILAIAGDTLYKLLHMAAPDIKCHFKPCTSLRNDAPSLGGASCRAHVVATQPW